MLFCAISNVAEPIIISYQEAISASDLVYAQAAVSSRAERGVIRASAYIRCDMEIPI